MGEKKKFIYPEKPPSIPKEDWNPLSRDNPDPKEETINESPLLATKDPSPDQGLDRLKDFVQRYLDERTKQKNPKAAKRLTAISAYNKIKKSA
jgi:hypothetical protein